jgi:hypothetical protein
MRNRFDLLDAQDAKIGLPAVEREQRSVVRAQPPWDALPNDREVEHPTQRCAIDGASLNPDPDKAPGELVHDHQNPVGRETDRLAAKQIHAPEAVAGVP